ncbi:MAG: hypothetical protein HY905_15775 [Deltaproteobacteria bacterium]|nr:hypothetical protein [Deltaproteobacteria bacterium]
MMPIRGTRVRRRHHGVHEPVRRDSIIADLKRLIEELVPDAAQRGLTVGQALCESFDRERAARTAAAEGDPTRLAEMHEVWALVEELHQ